MDFSALTTIALSDYTEEIFVPEFGRKHGYFPFKPAINASHPIDSLMLSGASIFGLDIKAKCRRKWYEDTGCDYNDIKTYLKLPFPVYLLWCCPIEKRVYGNWLNVLKDCMTIEGSCAYFPLNRMIPFRDLTNDETKFILDNTRSKYY